MGITNIEKLFSGSVAKGATYTYTWSQPIRGAVLSFFANASPKLASGETGTGTVRIGDVKYSHTHAGRDGTEGTVVSVDVLNVGDNDATFDLYVSWVGAPRSVMFVEQTIHFTALTGMPAPGTAEVFFGYGRSIVPGISDKSSMPVGVAIQGFSLQYDDKHDRQNHQVAVQTIAVSNVRIADVSDTKGRGSKVLFNYQILMEDTDARAKGTISFLVSAMVSEEIPA